MEKLPERFDEVFAGVNMNRFELQRPEERISLSRPTPCKLFVRPAIRPAERVEHHHLPRLGVRADGQGHVWHCKFTLITDHKRNDIVLPARDLERPL